MDLVEKLLLWIVLIGAAVAAVIGIWRAFRGASRFFEKVNRFFEDWYGRPAEDGHHATKGVLTRLEELEDQRAINSNTLGRVEGKMDFAMHELTPNKGGSIKDSINRIEFQQQEEILERKAFTEKYEQDQATNRLERHALTRVIKEMIGKTPEDQHEIWDRASASWTTNTLHEVDTP